MSSPEERKGSGNFSISKFMFGNIDENGDLVDEYLDGSQKMLGNLKEFLNYDEMVTDNDMPAEQDDYDGDEKVESVENYSDIEEVIDSSEDDEDSEHASSPETFASEDIKKEDLIDIPEDEDEKDSIKDSTLVTEEAPIEAKAEDIIDVKIEPETDRDLMPPPAPPQTKSKIEHKVPEKLLRKPLSAMLPEQYKGIDVRTFFPEYKPNGSLRFSRLFPIKPSLRPNIWKNVRRRFKKKLENEDEPAKKKPKEGLKLVFAPYPDDVNAFVEDQAIWFHKPLEEKTNPDGENSNNKVESRGAKQTDWRWGPAQYWYDIMDIPESVANFDYGLKISSKSSEDEKPSEEKESESLIKTEIKSSEPEEIGVHEDAFFMVSQSHWEDDVIWDGDDIKQKVLQKLSSKSNAAGWVPSGLNRTAFSQPGKNQGPYLQTMQQKKPTSDNDTWHSIFPVENEELVYGRWEDEVIWDHEKMPVRLEPKFVSLDPNDDNIILGIPEDIDPATLPSDAPVRKVKIIQKHGKKSKMLLNKSGIINVIEDESPPPPPKNDEKDPFNISNDEYYTPKTQDNLIKSASGSGLLQHAIPVVELQVPFVPTHMGPMKLRAFHRPSLRRFAHGALADCNSFHPINSLYKHMKRRAKAREAEREAAGGGDIFFMRTPEDVSGQDGELILFEYMEEYPPLLSLVGMCSKIKNYYKRKPGIDTPESNLKYGELTIAHSSPFLGQMQHGQTLQALENNLYRAPIYEHKVPQTDFLVIRTRNEFYIREVDNLYVCGQECPLYEVPAPNSKKANNFTRDFLQVFIFRLFWKSRDSPRRIKMDEIKKAFATHSESSIRKRLKPCAEFHRTGADSNWWVIKPGFRLPTEEEIRNLVSPEQCCGFFSMSAAEQRLKDAGYGEKSILAPQDDEDESSSIKLEDEVKCAPWNTTRAYMLAIKEKCLLQLTGPADPTGKAGEGFSYVRVPNKPTNKEEAESQPKRTVTGTDADLRKLPLKEARAILRQNKVPEEEIKKLSRWEVIDVVRTLSTEKVKAGDDCDFRFSRGNRFSIAEHHERYREDCQRIFEVQNTVLASDEILSSDEAESSEESDVDEEDLDEMGKNMEKLLANKKSSSQLQREREEMERRDLQRMILDGEKKQKDAKKKQQQDEDAPPAPPKILRITRTFRDDSGKEYVRTEIVRKPGVVDAYVRLRSTKDDTFIKEFATDAQDKEEMKKEKRRIQEQLRRLRRNEEKSKAAAELALARSNKRRRVNDKLDLKLKCGACGGKGHMRTNKACPKYVPGEFDDPNSFTEKEDEDTIEKEMKIEESEDLINVDGTKVKVNAKVFKQVDEIRRKFLRDPKSLGKAGGKRRRAGTVDHCDYLTTKNYRPVKRRRTDPLITLGSCLDKILCDLRSTEESAQFWQPVNTKKVVDYLDKIKRPMDLQTVRDSVQKKKYHSREEFLDDIHQIVENSAVYNGENDIITMNARKVLEIVIGKLSEKEEFMMKLEAEINPLLDDNDQVRLTFILESILNEKIKVMQESWPFMKPVNRKQMKVYYEMIKEPMDLEAVSKKVAKHAYHSRYEFLHDIQLIYKNALQFNGEKSEFTQKAQRLLAVTQETLDAYAEHLEQLEGKIRVAQQRALDQADLDSIANSTGDFDDGSKRRRGRPRKFLSQSLSQEEGDSQMSPAEYPEEGNSRSNLEDDLQYTSDDDEDGDEDEDDEEWLDVNDPNISMQGRNFAEDQESAAHALVSMGEYFTQQGDMVEEDVDENYDPTDFLQGLGQQQNPQPIFVDHGEVIEAIPVQISDENVAAMLREQAPQVDVVNDDLDISDSNDEDSDQNSSMQPQQEVAGSAPNDEDGIWF